jgi:lipoprotein-releasing system permease protein
LGLVPHIVISQTLGNQVNQADTVTPHWQKYRAYLLTQSHIKQVTPFIETEVLLQSQAQTSNSLQGVLLQGIMPEFEQDNIVNQNMTAGSLASLTTGKYNLVLGASLARKLSIEYGDTVRLVLLNKTVFTPMGRVPVQRTFTVSGIFNVGSQVDDAMVYIHSDYAAKLLRRKGDGIEQLRLYLDDAFNAQQVVKEIKANTFTNNLTHMGTFKSAQFTTWDESQGVLFSAVKMEKNMMWLMLSLIIAVATFNIISALVMAVIDKQGEIGILQTLGMNRLGIMKIFMTQGMVNGIFGTLLGGIIGIILTLNLNDVLAAVGIKLYGVQSLPVVLNGEHVVIIIFSAVLMSFLATLYPAYRASTTQPAEVLRNE